MKFRLLKLHGFLPYRLSILSNRISAEISRLYVDRFAISVPEWRVIAILGDASEDVTATRVARLTAMDKVAVTRAVQQLVKKGFVERRASQRDGRVAYLSLSRPGWQVYRDISPLALDYEAELLDALSAKERRHLDAIMDKLHRRLDNRGEDSLRRVPGE